MKKLILIIFLALLVITGCKNNISDKTKYTFKAEVIENRNENVLLVKALDDKVFKKEEQVVVHLINHEVYSISYQKEMIIEITFDGNIEETYPPQITSSEIGVLEE